METGITKWEADALLKIIPDAAPSKMEISKAVTALALSEQDQGSKFVYVKALEEFCKQYIVLMKDKAKEYFVQTFNGETVIKAYGVKIELKNYSKSKALKKDYTFSAEVQSLQNKIDAKQAELKALEEGLKAMKTMEIQTGIAKEIKWEFDEPANPLDDFQMFITLRKEDK